MLRLTFIILLLFLGQVTFGQKKSITKDQLLFEKAFLLQQMVDEDLDLDETIEGSTKLKAEYATGIRESILEKALGFYNELLDSFPKSKLRFRALNNKGFIELSLDDTAEAKTTFLAILNSVANDKEKGGVGSGLMGEPYANYKNRAAKMLAHIGIQTNNWNEALEYLDLTRKFPYRHFCGNEYAADEIYMAELYAQCYLGLRDYRKAYNVLLPNILENGLADNSNLVDTAYAALLKTHNKDDLRRLFDIALQDVKTEKIKQGKNEYERQYITFLDTKIEINSWRYDFTNPYGRDKAIAEIQKHSKFYKLLTN
jgi:hypothetical protein